MNSYRPSYDNRRGGGGRRGGRGQQSHHSLPPRPPPGRDYNNRPPSPNRHHDDRRGGYDDRRGPPPPRFGDHRPPQGDFTFRMDGPPGMGADSFRPGPPNQGRRGNYRGRGGRGRYQRPLPAERRMLKEHEEVREDLVDEENATTYRNIDELSDDEEAAMDFSDQSDDEEGQPASKRARTSGTEAAAEQTVPKWSNPDADTALPPDENTRKKKDMVKLIRKARQEDNSAARLAASTEAEDFISFDFGEDGAAKEDEQESDEEEAAESASAPPPPSPPAPRAEARRPARDDDPLGSRKRTYDDEIKPPSYAPRKNVRVPARGRITHDWAPKRGEDPCPWLYRDHSKCSSLSLWLHKEISDFYDYVKPRDFEERIRGDLVEEIRTKMQRNPKYKGFEVRPFGSFMSGLYLPTADMDLVICSKGWLNGGMSAFPNASSLHRFKAFLVSNRLADPNSVEVIAKARVPLVKYVDIATGLRVDISFDKPDGPAAIGTFLSWKDKHPALAPLVTIIKHFLAMRGLNEPVNGGIGSFSVSCMVMSMLQLMPQVQSGNLVPEHHLGEMLLEFLDLYGNKFDFMHTAIRVNPAGYVAKLSKSHNLTYKNKDRLSIIDPNNSSNDIAGGSSNAETILYEFHVAERQLRRRMADLMDGDDDGPSPPSILEVLLAGDYSSFRQQREHLRRLHEKYENRRHN
ncbi:hypothetical protein F5X68DRAFT_261286 [Plectosphaerella plurivora]|uniref:polynucleotide adenylyltransferase n=1 Tax=Plectosphaerella plurivora TaxID=936078 RepID=A0A9P9A904_9PEZI|nr:hypothetical protein F5X68DRAFT_261286 [Plectosphaerella plurivora]